MKWSNESESLLTDWINMLPRKYFTLLFGFYVIISKLIFTWWKNLNFGVEMVDMDQSV